jgi:thioredoxin 2
MSKTRPSRIRTCGKCGQKNRVASARLDESVRCGACKAPLPAWAEPVNVGAEEFAEIVNNVSVPVLVDFWAEWCAPCRMAAPHVTRVAQEMAGRAVVLKVDTEAVPELAQRFEVRGIPNFAVFKNGEKILQEAGLVDAATMKDWLEQATS